jgi:hypothetical protein
MTDTFRFNRNYDDLEQVRAFLPAFEARLAELNAAGQYRYNDAFKGHVPGIEGPDEETAIYLLQCLEGADRRREEVDRMLANGYRFVDQLDATTRFAHVVLVPTHRHQGAMSTFRDARVVPRDGRLFAVLPKGKRTNGILINERRVLVRDEPLDN